MTTFETHGLKAELSTSRAAPRKPAVASFASHSWLPVELLERKKKGKLRAAKVKREKGKVYFWSS